MTDWLEIVDSALKSACSRAEAGNRSSVPGTENNTQTIDSKRNGSFCSRVPGVPETLEEEGKDKHEKLTHSSFSTPAGDGLTDESAPHEEPIEHACLTCDHFRRPGLSDGFCGGGLEDLPPAYTPGHPLRRLPEDAGANCPNWVQHWSFPRVLPEKTHEGTESPESCVVTPSKTY